MSENPLPIVKPSGGDGPLRPPTDYQSRSLRLNSLWRYGVNHLVTGLAVLSTVLVIVPLVAIFVYLLYKGASSLNLAFFTHIPAPVGETGGGMANSMVGSELFSPWPVRWEFRWALRRASILPSMGRANCWRVRSGSLRMY